MRDQEFDRILREIHGPGKVREAIWPYGAKLIFDSFLDMEEYFESHFEIWKKEKIRTKAIGLTLYIFEKSKPRTEGGKK